MKNIIATFLIASIATLGVARAEEMQPAVDNSENKDLVAPIAEPVAVPDTASVLTEISNERSAAEEKVPEATTELSVEATPEPAPTAPQTDEKPYTHVGKASHDSVAAARSKQWQNIWIAVGAVAIAITALILVHNNAGH